MAEGCILYSAPRPSVRLDRSDPKEIRVKLTLSTHHILFLTPKEARRLALEMIEAVDKPLATKR